MNKENRIPTFPNPMRRERLLNLADTRRASADADSAAANEAPLSDGNKRISGDEVGGN